MTDRIEQLLADYWDAAYAEGKEGRAHDTEDAKAQKALSGIRAEFKTLRQRVNELEKKAEMSKAALVDADHLADVAEKFLAALNKVDSAQAKMDSRGFELDREALEQAEELRGEYWRAIQSAVYEYRKRAERARAAMVPNAGVKR